VSGPLKVQRIDDIADLRNRKRHVAAMRISGLVILHLPRAFTVRILYLPRADIMQRWLARLSFSFFIIAAVLLWEAWNCAAGRRPGTSQWRITLYLVAAMMAMALGALGIRARHRDSP
jgi:RsiW-degrading membrane proteinase PrsW (M82 family)